MIRQREDCQRLADDGGGLDVVVDEGGGLDVVVDEGGGLDVVVDEGGGLDVVVDEGGGRDVVVDEGGGLDDVGWLDVASGPNGVVGPAPAAPGAVDVVALVGPPERWERMV